MSDRIGTHRYSSNLKFTMISLLILGFLAGVTLMVFPNSHMGHFGLDRCGFPDRSIHEILLR